MGYAFISYSTKNQSDADALRYLLVKKGVDTWMAPYDIPVGAVYAEVVAHAIKECACFVLLLTDAAQNSHWVPKELERAVNYGKTILPIRLENTVLNEEFGLYIATTQIVSAQRVEENEEGIKKALARISALTTPKLLQEQVPKQTPSSSESRTSKQPTGSSIFLPKKQYVLQTILGILISCIVLLSLFVLCGIWLCIEEGFSSSDIEMLIFFGGIDLASIVSAHVIRKACKQATKYALLLHGIGAYSIDEIAAKTGNSSQETKKEISMLITRRYLHGIYIDHQTNEIVVTNSSTPASIRIQYTLALILHISAHAFGWLDGIIYLIMSPADPSMFIPAILCLALGFAISYTAVGIRKFATQKLLLHLLIHTTNCRKITEFAMKAGLSDAHTKKALASMISCKLLKNAYIDEQTQQLVFMQQ